MPDLLSQLLGFPGLGWLVAGVFVAGAVRGFSGFGAALVYMPIAGQFMPPVWALITLVVMEVFGPIPNLPSAWRVADRREVARLAMGGIVALPIGLALLLVVRPEVFRYAVSAIALLVPLLLAAGLRLPGPIRPWMQYGTGLASGFIGGVAGLPAPPVILLYMASRRAAAVIRANIMIYLLVVDLALIVMLSLTGQMSLQPLMLGLLLAVPNLLGNLAGAAMFRPERQRLYRWVGYGVTMTSALNGLPLWD